jgi:hypothetical protein
MDIKKRVTKRRQELRIRIENYKITKELSTLDFRAVKHVTRSIERAERELDMLERTWKF